MAVQLNHTIVASRDALAGATFLSEILGLPAPLHLGRFEAVSTQNGVSLDYATVGPDDEIVPQHYAFLIDESDFDPIFDRIRERGLDFWADPGQTRPGEISTGHGRGCYFLDPDGHYRRSSPGRTRRREDRAPLRLRAGSLRSSVDHQVLLQVVRTPGRRMLGRQADELRPARVASLGLFRGGARGVLSPPSGTSWLTFADGQLLRSCPPAGLWLPPRWE
jgi:hypothetical protein